MIEVRVVKDTELLGEILELGEAMFEESRFSHLDFDVELAYKYGLAWMVGEEYLFIGAFEGGQLVGMIAGECGAVLPFSSSIISNEHIFYVKPEFRGTKAAPKLIRVYVEESLRRGAKDIVFTNGTGYQPEKVGQLFEACGLKQVGGLYILEM